MAIRIAMHQVCDRCGRPYAEEHLSYGQEVPKVERSALQLSLGDNVVLRFEDLCGDCDRVVQSLIKRLKMESEPKKIKDPAEASPRVAEVVSESEPPKT